MRTIKKLMFDVAPFVFRLFLCVIFGTIILTMVYSLSVDIIERNVKSSYEIFEAEKTHPAVSVSSTGFLDNYSDAVMLLEAAFDAPDDFTPIKQAMNSSFSQLAEDFSMPKDDPNEIIVRHYRDNEAFLGRMDYFRYWHGYLIFLKPLLMVTNYSGVRLVNTIVQIMLIGYTVYLLWKREKRLYILPYLLIILALRPFVSFMSLQYAACFYTFSIASIALLRRKGIEKDIREVSFVFLFSGIAIAFFDLLSYPLITFGIPAVFFLMLSERASIKINLIRILKIGISWVFGYAGMWASKWILGSLILRRNILKDGINSVFIRTGGQEFSIGDSIGANIAEFCKTPFWVAIIVFVCTLLLMTLARVILSTKMNGRNMKKYIAIAVKMFFPFAVVALAPIVWYSVLVNHSCVHFYLFANKIFSISVLSIMFFAVKLYSYTVNHTIEKPAFKRLKHRIKSLLAL